MRRGRWWLCGLALSAFAAVACAQDDGRPAPTPGMTLHVSARLVLLDAEVVDKKTGAPLDRLTLDDFVLREDGVEQKLTYISQDELPLSVGLMFDLTDTVQPVLRHLAQGAREVLAHLRPTDEVAVMTFSNHVRVVQGFTRDQEAAKFAIMDAAFRHDRDTPTFIHEAVYTATQEMSKATIENSRRVEVWLTDGTSNYTNPMMKHMGTDEDKPEVIHTKEEAVGLVTHSSTAVAVLLERSFMTDAQIPLMPLTGRLGEINEYADMTGGPVLHTSGNQVAERMSMMIDALRKRYTLGYRPSAEKAAGTVCHLKLELTPAFFARHPGLGKKQLDVRTRTVYVR